MSFELTRKKQSPHLTFDFVADMFFGTRLVVPLTQKKVTMHVFHAYMQKPVTSLMVL